MKLIAQVSSFHTWLNHDDPFCATMYQPTYDVQSDLYLTGTWILIFFAIDLVFKHVIGWMVKEHNTRYFTLHVICNGIVTCMAFPDTVRVYMVPAEEIFMDPVTDTRACMIIAALHIYHILAYQPLNAVDWTHHILMVVITLPLAYGMQPGPLLNHGAFFASGLPGGLDYLMLVCVKAGWMKSIEEKRINSNIQSWLRNPGMLYHALYTWSMWIAMRSDKELGKRAMEKSLYSSSFMFGFAAITTVICYFWNGPYFQQRVAENYGLKSQQRTQSNRKKM